ncbi:MAG TPA: hypothetical protein VL463_21645 [Kofleriaceae bacterium]|nr:hypothetical protein [Kofleriaceae bacterium]
MNSAHAQLEAVLDRLIAEHTRDAGEVVAARREYEDRRGRVFEDEDLWEAWSAAFIEWYLVERLAGDHPVAARSLTEARIAGDDELAAQIRAYLTSHRSLFEVRALGGGRVELVDLIGGASFWVAEPRTLHGVEVGDVAELRVIGWGGEVLFGRTFVYHPPAARAAIAGHVKALAARGDDRRAIVDHVAALRIKVDRYKHVAPSKVYELDREKISE